MRLSGSNSPFAFVAFCLERRERPRRLAHEADGAPQIGLHRLADDLLDLVVRVADERVHHHRDDAAAGMARLAPCAAIERDLLGHFLDRLPEQMRQHVRAGLRRGDEALGIAGDRDPDRQLLLDRPRQDPRLHGLAGAVDERQRLAAPQAAHGSICSNISSLRFLKASGCRTKSFGCQPGANEIADAAIREVVDDRPFLGDAQHRSAAG